MRHDDDWVRRLSSKGSERESALEELRAILVRGLRHSLASSRYGGGELAEDIAQDALLKILDKLDSFEGRSRFTTWAMTVATRLGISEVRRRRYKDVSLEGLSQGGALKFELAIDPAASVEEQLEKERLLTQLNMFISESLTDRQRLAMRALLEGLPVEEIARRFESNRNAVYKLIHDARKRLKQSFENAGVGAEEVAKILS